jgi:Protein of unknown function (DUF4238)
MDREAGLPSGVRSLADNKNQHFVPQFYLRNFSTDEEKQSIGLFNFARSTAVGNASIRNQCSRDY